MLAHQIADLRHRLREAPEDIDAWVDFCCLRERFGEVDELERLRPGMEIRDRLWHRVTEDLSLVTAVLPLFGMRVVEDQVSPPGRFWEDHYRLGEGDGFFFDRRTGFPLEVERISDGGRMVLVPEGAMRRMTIDHSGSEIVDRTTRVVPAFLCDRYPITAGQYASFLQGRRRKRPAQWEQQLARPRRPVVFVDSGDIHEYACWAGGALLGSIGWEKASRGPGGSATPWPDLDRPSRRANVMDLDREAPRASSDWDRFLEEVDLRPDGASLYGVEGAAGNVREWCADHVSQGGYGGRARERRHVRGSSWRSRSDTHLLAGTSEEPAKRLGDLGFRLGRPLSALVRSIDRIDLRLC